MYQHGYACPHRPRTRYDPNPSYDRAAALASLLKDRCPSWHFDQAGSPTPELMNHCRCGAKLDDHHTHGDVGAAFFPTSEVEACNITLFALPVEEECPFSKPHLFGVQFHYTRRVVDTAVRLVVEDGLPYRAAAWTLWRDHRVFVPSATIQNWVEAGGEKAASRGTIEHLDWALSGFSGSIAADELYDGPFRILSIVDNRTYERLSYDVLSRAPTARDVEASFRRFHAALEARADRQGDHHRRLGTAPRADRRCLRRRAPSGLHLPRPS